MRRRILPRTELNRTKNFSASLDRDEFFRAGRAGSRLPADILSYMNAAFGADFSDVTVHSDDHAAMTSKRIQAKAFTYGSDVFFGKDKYDPNSRAGKRLLAHELTHVLQQAATRGAVLQRDEEKAAPGRPPKVDVALLLDDSSNARIEAQTYAPIVIRATSSADAKKKLKALGKPIRTLYVVSHSNRLGEVQVVSRSGILSWKKLSEFSKDLKGALPADDAPDLVDFRGCKLGEAPGEMETFRQNIAATSARATNCWSFVATVTPLTAPDGTEITSKDKIPKGMERQFNQALRTQINGLRSDDGRSVRNCITGLSRGETAAKSFAKIRSLYFANGGYLSAGWVSPEYNQNWQKGSMCAKDVTEKTSPCKIVVQNAPQETP